MPPLRTVGLLAAALVLATAGCSSNSSGAASGVVTVATSTNVYSDLVQQVAGRLLGSKVQVNAIISDPATDPHEYEASTRDQLTVKRADLLIENGGGYDDFMNRLRSASGSSAPVINAVDISGKPQGATLNEHVWYDFPTVVKIVQRIAQSLAAQDKVDAAIFRANARVFVGKVQALVADEARIKRHVAGTGVAITEPVPLYLLSACGLVNRTPVEFSHAVEDGTDAAVRILHDTLGLFTGHQVKVLVYNAQTANSETDLVRHAAAQNNIPTIGVTETRPPGTSYLHWMQGYLSALAAALGVGLT